MKMAGGEGRPLRLSMTAVCVVSPEDQADHVRRNESVPFLAPAEIHSRKLAVVGGGPGVADRLDELRAFDGDIWAINYTAAWLAGQGIRSTMLTVDGQRLAPRIAEGVSEAIVASCVHPSTPERFSRARQFHLAEHDPDGVSGGTTTACRVPFLAIRQGYKDVTFYGCESSFSERDHADRHEGTAQQVIIRADGETHRTTPQLMVQADDLSAFLVGFPHIFRERSGGLLRAMMADPYWEVVAVSDEMKAHLVEVNGSTPFTDAYPVNAQ